MDVVIANGKTVASMKPGSFFGEIALVTGGERTATIKAKTICDGGRVDIQIRYIYAVWEMYVFGGSGDIIYKIYKIYMYTMYVYIRLIVYDIMYVLWGVQLHISIYTSYILIYYDIK